MSSVTRYPVLVSDINDEGIRIECAKIGVEQIREVSTHGEGDARVTVYAIPVPEGGEVEVAHTNGDPVWREACDPEDWAALVGGPQSCYPWPRP